MICIDWISEGSKFYKLKITLNVNIFYHVL